MADQWGALLESVDRLQSADGEEVLVSVLKVATERLELRDFSFGVHLPMAGGRAYSLLLHSYDEGMVGRYCDEYAAVDPILRQCMRQPAPARWSDFAWCVEADNPTVRRMVEDTEAHGLGAGFTLGVQGARGETGVLALSVDREMAYSASRHISEAMVWFQALAPYLHQAVCRLAKGACFNDLERPLTPRETECLQWVVAGKSSWEIGTILAISERTVVQHLTNAMVKLGVKNRQQAVAKAVMLGVVTP